MGRASSAARTTVEPRKEPIRSPTSNPLKVDAFLATVLVRRSGFITSLANQVESRRCVEGRFENESRQGERKNGIVSANRRRHGIFRQPQRTRGDRLTFAGKH